MHFYTNKFEKKFVLCGEYNWSLFKYPPCKKRIDRLFHKHTPNMILISHS